jgi:hypothetical protein
MNQLPSMIDLQIRSLLANGRLCKRFTILSCRVPLVKQPNQNRPLNQMISQLNAAFQTFLP